MDIPLLRGLLLLPAGFLIIAFFDGAAIGQDARSAPVNDRSVEISGVVVRGLSEAEATAATEIDPNEIVVERKVCEYVTATGSIRPKKRCRTRSQAEYEAEVGRETIRILRERQLQEEFVRMRQRDGAN